MRVLAPLVLLLLCANPSFGQAGSGKPHPDSLVVCFTLAEAEFINDTLWSGVDRRRAYAVLWAMYRNAEKAGRGAEEDLKVVRAALSACRDAEAVERAGREKAEAAEKKARRGGDVKFWVGLGLGALAGGGATYGATRAGR